MAYKIIVDSSCDLTDEMKSWGDITSIPLTIKIGDYEILDDENFDQDDFIGRMTSSNEKCGSACPSPSAFADACEGEEEDVYIVCITDKMSGCYNSALQGVSFYQEEHEDEHKNIHVFNSLSAAGHETLLAMKIHELANSGMSFDDVVKECEDYSYNHCTLLYAPESFDMLKNSGRLFTIATKILEATKIKLLMGRVCDGSDKDGTLTIVGKDLTAARALKKITSVINKDTEGSDLSNKKAIITQVCCPEKAENVANLLKKECGFGEVIVIKGGGLNSLYCSKNGIIVCYEK